MLSKRQTQKNLKHLGYYTGGVDGIFGAKTKAAVKSFQSDSGLAVDGIYGKQTDAKLVAAVKDIQGKLNVSADGIIGAKTINAIKTFQKENGLTVDGICGAKTRAVLNTGSEIDWSKVKWSVKDDFKCKCKGAYCTGWPAELDRDLIEVLEAAQEHFGEKFTVVSGERCPTWNKKCGGVTGSRHTRGKAADVYGLTKSEKIRDFFKTQKKVRYTYINSGRAVHVDVE